jgi:hypothetical protein
MNKKRLTCLLIVSVISTASLCIGWGKKDRTTEDFMKIAAAGSGLVLDAGGRDAGDLMKIAAVCGSSSRTLHLKNCGAFETADLMKIAAVGGGHVILEF